MQDDESEQTPKPRSDTTFAPTPVVLITAASSKPRGGTLKTGTPTPTPTRFDSSITPERPASLEKKSKEAKDHGPDSDHVTVLLSSDSDNTQKVHKGKTADDEHTEATGNSYKTGLSMQNRPRQVLPPQPSSFFGTYNRQLDLPSAIRSPVPHSTSRKRKRVSFSSPLVSPYFQPKVRSSSPIPVPATRRKRQGGPRAPEDGQIETIIISSSDEESRLVTDGHPPGNVASPDVRSFLKRGKLTPLRRGRSGLAASSSSSDEEIETPTPLTRTARNRVSTNDVGQSTGQLRTQAKPKESSSSPLKRKWKEAIRYQDEDTDDDEIGTGAPGADPYPESGPVYLDPSMAHPRLDTAQLSYLPRTNDHAAVPEAIASLSDATILVQEASEDMNLHTERLRQQPDQDPVRRLFKSFHPPLETKFPLSHTEIRIDRHTKKAYKKLRKEATRLLKIADDLQPYTILQSTSARNGRATESNSLTDNMAIDWKELTAKMTLVIINLRATIDVWNKTMEAAWKKVVRTQHKHPSRAARAQTGAVEIMDKRMQKAMKSRAKQRYRIAKMEAKLKGKERKEVEERLSHMNEVGMWGTGSVFAREKRARREVKD